MSRSLFFPATHLILIIVTFLSAVLLGHVFLHQPLEFLDYQGRLGLDYRDYYLASANLLHGQSPYQIPDDRYVTTPVPALLNIPFVFLSLEGATLLYTLLIPVTLLWGYYHFTNAFAFVPQQKSGVLLAGLVGVLFGYPFYFLLQRGNIDGWVFLLLGVGLVGLLQPRHPWFFGLLLSLAIAFKIYPILVLLPLLFSRQWRLFAWVCVWLVAWGVLAALYLPEMQHALTLRAQNLFRFDENGSLVATVSLGLVFISALGLPSMAGGISLAPLVASLTYGVLISLVIYTDYKLSVAQKYHPAFAAFYLPFMVALPQTVYHYSFVICLLLIPALCQLWLMAQSRANKIVLFVITLGLALTQLQAVALAHLTANALAQGLPGLGLLVIMLGIVVFKILLLRAPNLYRVQGERGHPPK